METYSYAGTVHDSLLNIEVPFEFSLVLAPDADESVLECAIQTVAIAIASKLSAQMRGN